MLFIKELNVLGCGSAIIRPPGLPYSNLQFDHYIKIEKVSSDIMGFQICDKTPFFNEHKCAIMVINAHVFT